MNHFLFIDLSSIAHPLWHTSAGDPDPNATSTKTVARIRALASGQPHVAVCCDSGRSFRKDVDPSYKANRPESDAALHHQIDLAMEILRGDGFPVWAVKGFEADDLLAAAVGTALLRDEAPTVTIASSDKDLLQLVGPRVTVHRLTDGATWNEATVVEKIGVRADQMCDYLSLVGDTSDNVRGADGIGPKKAAALLERFGNLEDMFAAVDKGDAKFQPSTLTALAEFRPRLQTVRDLIALRADAPIPFAEVLKERVPLDVATFDDEGSLAGSSPAPVAGAGDAGSVTPSRSDQPLPAPLPFPAPRQSQSAIIGGVGQMVPASAAPIPTRVQEPEVLPPPSTVFEMQLEPRSLREAALVAQEAFKSRNFSAYGTSQGIMMTILAGRELGLQAMASLRGFHIIDGKPALSADLIRALVTRSPHCEYFRCTERTNEAATWETKRRGDPSPMTLRFTIEDGKLASFKDEKSWKASGWGRNPADMCVARASAKLARLVYADVVFNLYAPEEME